MTVSAPYARYLSANTPSADLSLFLQQILPPIELRQQAALYHSAMIGAEDQIHTAEDDGMDEETKMKLLGAYRALANIYTSFCREQGFELLTSPCGLHLRCAETGIPLVETDECVETETGELRIVKQAA